MMGQRLYALPAMCVFNGKLKPNHLVESSLFCHHYSAAQIGRQLVDDHILNEPEHKTKRTDLLFTTRLESGF